MSYEPTAVIRDEAARFATVLAEVDGATPVPSCPGWTAADLLWHLTEVHLFWSSVIASGATTDEQVQAIEEHPPVRPTTRSEVLSRRARATEDLLAALLSGPLDAPAWSWFPPDQSVGFTVRMQTHEATIHRVDAELTAGLPISPIRADVAAAGIDHVLDVMWNWVPTSAEKVPLGVVELRPTETQPRLVELYRWTGEAWGQPFKDQIGGRRAPDGVHPDAVIEGPAQQLDLLVWSRPAIVTGSGDGELLNAFDELIAFGIQ
ncbi:TIGR03083 family protein [Tessaracoccus bendigoensis DSM 12906]|uniref:TIGR03083 family protein n=1 Tax=Tessaracoccus bendigoensis DSM 12906 TaxID=1123357 RepID=A0A1M6MME1_9ACTN|nr:maleylpyruvate isomerase family mycothiol-dependent enzyme [Tessaracoccus bendigoensis]SHJ84637.1 TIGR03083 family protein [Tessaracoccus bendigoensis DSM 12906]